MDERMVDGNALGGPLAGVFVFDVTTARATCDHCGTDRVVAALHVYVDAPGVVVRCPDCEAVLLRCAWTGGRVNLDLRGMRVLTADDDPDSGRAQRGS